MSDKELKARIDAIRKATREACATPQTARAFLVKAGIVTKSGKLAKAYR